MNQSPKRSVEQDIAKGLAILFVIFIHSVQLKSSTMDIVLTFAGYAMPFFFLMSGYYYKAGRRTWRQNVSKRLRQLLLPLLVYSAAIYIIMYVFFSIRNEANITDALTSFASFWLTKPLDLLLKLNPDPANPFAQLMGPGWFLQYMITGCLIFYFVADYALKDIYRFISVNFMFVAVTAATISIVPRLPWGIHAAPLVASLMLFGALFGQRKLLETGTIPKKWNVINSVSAFCIYVIFMLLYPRSGTFISAMLGTEQIGIWDVPFTLMAGILGAYTLVNFCKLVANVKILGDGLSWCGRNSLSLMLVNVPIITIMQKCLGLTSYPVFAVVEHTKPISFAVFLGSVVFCVLLVLAINKVFPHKK